RAPAGAGVRVPPVGRRGCCDQGRGVNRVWEVPLPSGLELINSNQRLHHHQRARLTRGIREEALIASLAARVPVLGEVFVIGYVHPRSRRKFDPANLYPSFKAAVDGALVDTG